jgi:hypothetical protein
MILGALRVSPPLPPPLAPHVPEAELLQPRQAPQRCRDRRGASGSKGVAPAWKSEGGGLSVQA